MANAFVLTKSISAWLPGFLELEPARETDSFRGRRARFPSALSFFEKLWRRLAGPLPIDLEGFNSYKSIVI
jgi:hypothetical protein